MIYIKISLSDLIGMAIEHFSVADVSRALDFARLFQKLQLGPIADFVSPEAIQDKLY